MVCRKAKKSPVIVRRAQGIRTTRRITNSAAMARPMHSDQSEGPSYERGDPRTAKYPQALSKWRHHGAGFGRGVTDDPARRICRDHGPVGFGQVDADEYHRLSRSSDLR